MNSNQYMQIIWAIGSGSLVMTPLLLLATAAWRDLATRTIPNWTCLGIALSGIAGRGLEGGHALTGSAIVAVLLFLLLVPLHARGILGGGDVKLAAATSLGLSVSGTAGFIVATTMAGGVLAALHLLLRWLPDPPPSPPGTPTLRRLVAVERWRIRRHGPLPYGIAIACGGAWVIFSELLI